MDWTESPLIGLHFAVNDKTHDGADAALWALNPFGPSHWMAKPASRIFTPEEEPVRHLIEKAFAGMSWPEGPDAQPDAYQWEEVAFALVAREVDLRLMVQQAGFTIHGSGTPLNELHGLRNETRMVRIPADAKRGLRMELDALGIRDSVLFPDLAHLACGIENRWALYEDPEGVMGP
jgi:hypothetical protein